MSHASWSALTLRNWSQLPSWHIPVWVGSNKNRVRRSLSRIFTGKRSIRVRILTTLRIGMHLALGQSICLAQDLTESRSRWLLGAEIVTSALSSVAHGLTSMVSAPSIAREWTVHLVIKFSSKGLNGECVLFLWLAMFCSDVQAKNVDHVGKLIAR